MKYIYYLGLTLLLVACRRQEVTTPQDEIVPTYHDGTYKTIVEGYGGEFEVIVEIKDDKLTSVEVENHKETPSIGGMAISTLKEEMVRLNTYDVDVVTGATYTSQALKSGVRSLMDQAKNGDYTKTDTR